MEIMTTSNDIWQIPFVDVKHLKRRSHLKGHYLPTSGTKVLINQHCCSQGNLATRARGSVVSPP